MHHVDKNDKRSSKKQTNLNNYEVSKKRIIKLGKRSFSILSWYIKNIKQLIRLCLLVKYVEDMIDNLLTHIQILTLRNPYDHGSLSAVTPRHES